MDRRDRYNPGSGFGAPRYPGTFLLAVREALAAVGWQTRHWHPAAVECLDPEGREQLLGLENLYRRVRRAERARWPQLLREFLDSVPAGAAGAQAARLQEVAARLLVRLGPPFARQEAESDVWCQAIVNPHIVASLVIDAPTSMAYVTEKMVADSGQPGTYWFEQALRNLRAQTPERCLAVAHAESGLLQSEVGDAYDSSRALLLDTLLPGHEERGFFVALPGRDHLFAVPVSARAVGFLPWLRAVAEKTHRDLPYPISAEVFWVRQGAWHRIAIDLHHPRVIVQPPPEFLAVLEGLAPAADEDEGT
jgi:hypothetical protein